MKQKLKILNFPHKQNLYVKINIYERSDGGNGRDAFVAR